jgi:excisionase family DNA binding protein
MSEDVEDVQVPAPPAAKPLLVRVEEAARLLSFSRSVIYEMMDSGELPSVRRGMARRIPYAVLQAWIEQHTQPHR